MTGNALRVIGRCMGSLGPTRETSRPAQHPPTQAEPSLSLTLALVKRTASPGLPRSSQATVLELWASLQLLRAPSASPDSPRPSQRHEPRRFNETRVLHRCLAGLGLPGLVWDSQATVLELWAPPELPGSPWTYLRPPWSNPCGDQPRRPKRGVM